GAAAMPEASLRRRISTGSPAVTVNKPYRVATEYGSGRRARNVSIPPCEVRDTGRDQVVHAGDPPVGERLAGVLAGVRRRRREGGRGDGEPGRRRRLADAVRGDVGGAGGVLRVADRRGLTVLDDR